jgi:hypothetical protein
MPEDLRMSEHFVDEHKQAIGLDDLEKIVDNATALQFIGKQVVAQLSPVPYGGLTFEENPNNAEIPAKDVAEIKRMTQVAISEYLQKKTGATGVIAVSIPLAQLANSYEVRDFARQPMDILAVAQYINAHKLHYSAVSPDRELTAMVVGDIKKKLQLWSDEKARVRTLLDKYAFALGALSNNVLALRHAAEQGQGSNEDYGAFRITINQSELQRFLSQVQEMKAEHARLQEVPRQAPSLDEGLAVAAAETSRVAEPDLNAAVRVEPVAFAGVTEAVVAQVAAPEDPAQTNREEPPVVTDRVEAEAAVLKDEAYRNATTIYELYAEMKKLAAAGFIFNRIQSGTGKPLEVPAADYLETFDKLVELMAAGDWTTLVLACDSRQLYKKYLSSVILQPLLRIIDQNYKREKELILDIAKQATTQEQATHILRTYRDSNPRFTLPGGIDHAGNVKPDYQFSMMTFFTQIDQRNLQHPDVQLAFRLMPKLAELFDPARNPANYQVESRVDATAELVTLQRIFYTQIGPEGSPAAQGLAESLANQLVNKIITQAQDPRPYALFVLLKSQISQYLHAGIYFIADGKKYDVTAILNDLSRLIESGSNGRLDTQRPENYPKVLGIKYLLQQVLSSKRVDLPLYVKELQGDEVLSAQQKKAATPAAKPWYKLW